MCLALQSDCERQQHLENSMIARMGYPLQGKQRHDPMCLKAQESVPMPEYAAEEAGAETVYGENGKIAVIFPKEVKTTKNPVFSY